MITGLKTVQKVGPIQTYCLIFCEWKTGMKVDRAEMDIGAVQTAHYT